MNIDSKRDLQYGFKRGLPIAIGYLPVSFTFGLMAVNGGLPVWLAIFISLSNLTSAGQFAGTNLIFAGAGLFEIGFTTFIINIRYMLMSLSLSQKIDSKIGVWNRLIFSFGITDETFSVASMEQRKLSSAYMFGLISGPIAGWSLGTALGAMICTALPQSLADAMGIALYGMFIAIIIPPARKSKPVVVIILLSIFIHYCLRYIPAFSFISSGFKVVIATVLSAGIGAILFPMEDKKEESV